jgi:hypothetical protein
VTIGSNVVVNLSSFYITGTATAPTATLLGTGLTVGNGSITGAPQVIVANSSGTTTINSNQISTNTVVANLTGNVVATTISGNLTGNVSATTITGNLTGNVSATTISVGAIVSITTANLAIGNSTANVYVNSTSFVGNLVATSISGNLTGNVAATTISGNLTGNVISTTINSSSANISNKVQIGLPSAFDFGSNAVIEIDGNSNTYIQVVIQNANTGNNASSDLVVTADTGNDSVDYVDLGINNSLYNQPSFNIIGAKDAYLYASNGHLSIGTLNQKEVIFHANGATTTNRVFTINATAVTVANAAALWANGGAGTAGQVLTSNGVGIYWAASAAGGVNTAAQYAWTNTHTFAANVTVGSSTVNSTFTSYFGMTNPNTFTMGAMTTTAGFNTVLAGPYTVATGNTLTITTGSRVVIV